MSTTDMIGYDSASREQRRVMDLFEYVAQRITYDFKSIRVRVEPFQDEFVKYSIILTKPDTGVPSEESLRTGVLWRVKTNVSVTNVALIQTPQHARLLLLMCLMQVEVHDCLEKFRFNDDAMFNPHRPDSMGEMLDRHASNALLDLMGSLLLSKEAVLKSAPYISDLLPEEPAP